MANSCGISPGPEWQFTTEKNGDFNHQSSYKILPEAIWATSTGGGIWMTEVQVTDLSGGSEVSIYFNYGGGNRRGPFLLWTSTGANRSVKYTNLLSVIETIDSGAFNYFNKAGAVEFMTQDSSHLIHLTARAYNGNYSKTFPGLNYVQENTANISRPMMIQNLVSTDTYRSIVGCFNPTNDSVTVEEPGT